MRRAHRSSAALALVATLAVLAFVGLAATSCSTGATGVDACHKIEDAACEAARSCGFTDAQVQNCHLYYHDECLYGIQSSGYTPTSSDVAGCIGAIQAAAACASSGVATLARCPLATVAPDAGIDAAQLAPCDVIQGSQGDLAACFWANAPPDAGAPVVVPDAAADGDAAAE